VETGGTARSALLDYLAVVLCIAVVEMQCFNSGKSGRFKTSPWLLFLRLTVRDVRGTFPLKAICWPQLFSIKTREFSQTPRLG
jgi:hypothetical protein